MIGDTTKEFQSHDSSSSSSASSSDSSSSSSSTTSTSPESESKGVAFTDEHGVTKLLQSDPLPWTETQPSTLSTQVKDKLHKRVVDMVLTAYGVPFGQFATFVKSTDPQFLSIMEKTWFKVQEVDLAAYVRDGFLRMFLMEHFKMHTKQAHRALDSNDINTLFWLKSLYEGTCKDQQHLPFAREPINFWKHFLLLESTLCQVRALWSFISPRVVYGFLSHEQTTRTIMQAQGHQADCYMFRLSNSEPTKLVFIRCKTDKGIQQTLLNAFKSGEEYSAFIANQTSSQLFVPPVAVGENDSKPVDVNRAMVSTDYINELDKGYSELLAWYNDVTILHL